MRRKHEGIAYHEAGHAVVAAVLQLSIGRRGLSIATSKTHSILGCDHLMARLRERSSSTIAAADKSHIEAWTIASLAGDAAELKLDGKQRFARHHDYQQALGLSAHISSSFEQQDARIEVARIGAKDLVEINWPAIQAVAKELLSKKKVSRAELKEIVHRCDEEYYAAVDQRLGLV
jgi:ATP-dependent Zn protease